MYRPPRFKQSSKKATMLQSSTSNLTPPHLPQDLHSYKVSCCCQAPTTPPPLPQGLHNCTRHHALLSSTSTFTPPRPIQSSIKASMKLSNTSPPAYSVYTTIQCTMLAVRGSYPHPWNPPLKAYTTVPWSSQSHPPPKAYATLEATMPLSSTIDYVALNCWNNWWWLETLTLRWAN